MEIDRAFWGLAGVVVGFTLTTLKDWWKHKATLQNDRYYLSVLTVSKLDDFFWMSCGVVSDKGRYVTRGEGQESYTYLEVETEIPIFELSSIDVDWRCLPQELMFELLTFPAKVVQANNMIAGAYEYQASPPDFDEFFQERRYQYATLGLKAVNLATRLRALSKLPAYKYGAECWDPVAELLKKQNEIEEIRQQYRVLQIEASKKYQASKAEVHSA